MICVVGFVEDLCDNLKALIRSELASILKSPLKAFTKSGADLAAEDCANFDLDILHIPTLSQLEQANLGQWIAGDKSLRRHIKTHLHQYTTAINKNRDLGLVHDKVDVQPLSHLLLSNIKDVYPYESKQHKSTIKVISNRPYTASTNNLITNGESDLVLVYNDCLSGSSSKGYALAVWSDLAINMPLNETSYAQVYLYYLKIIPSIQYSL